MANTLIEGELLPWQVKAMQTILNKEADILLLSGGFGSGKTAVNANIIQELCWKDKRRGLVIASTYPSLKDTVGITLEEEIGTAFIKDINRRDLQWTFDTEPKKGQKGDSLLLSRSMRYGHEAPLRLRSINADFLWLVEATLLPREAFTHGVSRLRKQGKFGYQPIILETNPSSKSNWVYTSLIEGTNEVYRSPDDTWWVTEKDYQQKVDRDYVTFRTRVIHTTTFANPHFSQTSLAIILKDYSPQEVQRLIYAVWNALEGRVIETYTVVDITKENVAKYDRILLGGDIGYSPDPTSIEFIGQKGEVFEVFDEIDMRQASVRVVYAEVLKRIELWGIQNREITLRIDPSDSGWLAEWRDIPGQKILSYKALRKGDNPALNRAVRLSEKMRVKKLLIGSNCKKLIEDIEQTTYKSGTSRSEIDKKAYNPHRLDALGYGIVQYF